MAEDAYLYFRHNGRVIKAEVETDFPCRIFSEKGCFFSLKEWLDVYRANGDHAWELVRYKTARSDVFLSSLYKEFYPIHI